MLRSNGLMSTQNSSEILHHLWVVRSFSFAITLHSNKLYADIPQIARKNVNIIRRNAASYFTSRQGNQMFGVQQKDGKTSNRYIYLPNKYEEANIARCTSL